MKRIVALAGAAFAAGASVIIGGHALAGPELVAFPEGYQSAFEHYLTVDRPDRKVVRFFYVNPEALEAAVPGEPLPHGTVLIMEDHPAQLDADEEPVRDEDGRFLPTDEVTNVFIMEKQPGWGAE